MNKKANGCNLKWRHSLNNNNIVRKSNELREKYNNLESEYISALENVKRIKCKCDELEKENNKINERYSKLNTEYNKVKEENIRLKTEMCEMEQSSKLNFGKEKEFFPGETTEILVSLLKDTLRNMQKGTRRYDIINSIIKCNDAKVVDKKINEIKKIFKNYGDMSTNTKKALEKMGFVVTDEGKHYKVTYNGDGRYMATLSRTPSKRRATMEMATDVITMAF